MDDPTGIRAWADRFALLGDPSRLMLLLVIHRAGSICVTRPRRGHRAEAHDGLPRAPAAAGP